MTAVADVHRVWRALPLGTLDDIIGEATCLILAPHPDDETLGCGGLIAACVEAGRPPLVVILTDGTGSHPASRDYPPGRLQAVRAQEVRTAVGHLGLAQERVVFLNQPDTAAPTHGAAFDAVVETVAALIRREPNCTTILSPWRHDPHCDHEAASLVAEAVAASIPVRQLAYPVWGWTLPGEAVVPSSPAGYRLDIARFLDAKRAAIQAHQSQYGDLITDDPSGFRLPAGLLSVFEVPFETFLLP